MPRDPHANVTGESLVELHLRAGDVQLSRGRTAFVGGPTGVIGNDPNHGLFVYQTRLLSKYRWLMNGAEPEFSCASNIQQHSWMGYYIQAPRNWKETPACESNPLQQTIELRLKRWVGEGMHEDVQLANYTKIKTEVQLDLEFEPQFISRKEASGTRKQHGKLSSHWRKYSAGVWELEIDYTVHHHYQHQGNVGNAELRRGLALLVRSAEAMPVYSDGRIRFAVILEPHAIWSCCLEWAARVDGRQLPAPSPHHDPNNQDLNNQDLNDSGPSKYERKISKDKSNLPSFRVEGDGDLREVVAGTARRAALDLNAMQMFDIEQDGEVALAAGIPTYMGVFGRDMLASAWQSVLLGPELALGSLRILKKYQASDVNDWRDAEPGRIVHEMHTDPLSVLNFTPKSSYFGSVSGSFLYPILLAELWHWSGDLDVIRPFVEPAVKALTWADVHSRDETGFYRYQTKSKQGMKNQGWKDSEDAIVYPDGSQVATPIGTCEMQAFAYAAKRQLSEILWWVGEPSAAARVYREATELKERFNERFWMDDEGTYAMGIDHEGELIRSVASDPGHCLLSGIADDSRVPRLANRLLRDDMFSGWGVRTLSSDHPAYNPFSYHRGSVWPVENGSFVLGFARYGLHGEMHRLARSMFEAAQLFPHYRLPETMGGHQRTADAPFPGLYTKADWPQAWSASSVITILRAMLGLFPYAAANLLILDPHLPAWLPELTLENMRIGRARSTIHFARQPDGSTDYRVVEREGDLHVLRQPSPWSLTSDWPERVKDTLFSLLPGH